MSDEMHDEEEEGRVDFIREGVRRRREITRSGQLQAAMRENSRDRLPDDDDDEDRAA